MEQHSKGLSPNEDETNIPALAAYLRCTHTNLILTHANPLQHTCQVITQIRFERLLHQEHMPQAVHSRHGQCWELLSSYWVKFYFPAAPTTGSSFPLWSYTQSTNLMPSPQKRLSIVEYRSHVPSVFSGIFSRSFNHSPYDTVSSTLHHSYHLPLNTPSFSTYPFETEMLRMEDDIIWVCLAPRKPRLWSSPKIINSCNTAYDHLAFSGSHPKWLAHIEPQLKPLRLLFNVTANTFPILYLCNRLCDLNTKLFRSQRPHWESNKSDGPFPQKRYAGTKTHRHTHTTQTLVCKLRDVHKHSKAIPWML